MNNATKWAWRTIRGWRVTYVHPGGSLHVRHRPFRSPQLRHSKSTNDLRDKSHDFIFYEDLTKKGHKEDGV